jgi:hypothetical protein
MIMENNNTISEQTIEHTKIAMKQLAYYHANDLCVIQDRDDVRYLAAEFGDVQLALLTEYPHVFDVVCKVVAERASEDTF